MGSWFAIGLALVGCAGSEVPAPIRTAPTPVVEVAAVQRLPEAWVGREVRWGGTILAVDNRESVTEVMLLARPLGEDGRPRLVAGEVGGGLGRFIAEVPGFVDPSELPTERLLTVAGTISGLRVQAVGEYPYRFPVVAVSNRYLWPLPVPRAPDPWCCGPWGPGWGSAWGPGWGPGWGPPWYRPWYW